MSKDNNIVITSAARTAIGTFDGSLKDMQAKDLGASVVRVVMKRSNLKSNDWQLSSWSHRSSTYVISEAEVSSSHNWKLMTKSS